MRMEVKETPRRAVAVSRWVEVEDEEKTSEASSPSGVCRRGRNDIGTRSRAAAVNRRGVSTPSLRRVSGKAAVVVSR